MKHLLEIKILSKIVNDSATGYTSLEPAVSRILNQWLEISKLHIPLKNDALQKFCTISIKTNEISMLKL